MTGSYSIQKYLDYTAGSAMYMYLCIEASFNPFCSV